MSMFGGNKNETSRTAMGGVSHNSLVKGTVVKGEVRSESDIRIDGRIEGQLFCDAKVVIGATGFIQGTIRCKDAVIEGQVEGDIFVDNLLKRRQSAKLNGKIQTAKLIVEAGAVFTGHCSMGKAPANSGADGARKSANIQQNQAG